MLSGKISLACLVSVFSPEFPAFTVSEAFLVTFRFSI